MTNFITEMIYIKYFLGLVLYNMFDPADPAISHKTDLLSLYRHLKAGHVSYFEKG
jgi:hypothetical protein